VGSERSAGGRIDEFLTGGLGMVDYPLHILSPDPPLLHKTPDFIGHMHMYLLVCIHLVLSLAKGLMY
jgi:hypothetical protein